MALPHWELSVELGQVPRPVWDLGFVICKMKEVEPGALLLCL